MDLRSRKPLFLFVGGLHRSGTTALYELIGSEERVSVFRETGVPKNEGQFLQSVVPNERSMGGIGAFALNPAFHWTESSEWVEPARRALFEAWAPHWDLSRPVLAEKTPSNLIRTRFLRTVFGRVRFLVTIRHPVPVIVASTRFRPKRDAELVLRHWLAAYRIFRDDTSGHDDWLLLRYERFVENPAAYEPVLADLLGFSPSLDYSVVQSGMNEAYFEKWRRGILKVRNRGSRWTYWLRRRKNRVLIKALERRYEEDLNEFGYSFGDVGSMN